MGTGVFVSTRVVGTSVCVKVVVDLGARADAVSNAATDVCITSVPWIAQTTVNCLLSVDWVGGVCEQAVSTIIKRINTKFFFIGINTLARLNFWWIKSRINEILSTTR